MELEEGKWYAMRDPSRGPVGVSKTEGILFRGRAYHWYGTNNNYYNDAGRCIHGIDLDVDLVAEVPAEAPTLQLQEGKLYQRRDSRLPPISVKKCEGGIYQWVDEAGNTYTDNGELDGKDAPHPRDLVAEVPAVERPCFGNGSYSQAPAEPTLGQRVVELEREVAELRRDFELTDLGMWVSDYRAPEIEKEREKFERWANAQKFKVEIGVDREYISVFAKYAWRSWLTAKGLA